MRDDPVKFHRERSTNTWSFTKRRFRNSESRPACFAAGLCLAPASARRVRTRPSPRPRTPAEAAADANKLAQELANPVANLWSLTLPVQQLPADQRPLELQPEFPARDARQPDEGHQPDHPPRDPGLQQRSLRDLHGRRGAHHQFRRLDAARALLAGAQRLLAARLRPDLHLSNRRLRLHRAGKVSGGPRPRRRLHDAQVHPRGLPAAVVVVRRRREPARTRARSTSSRSRTSSSRAAGTSATRATSRPAGRTRATTGGPSRSASASARSSSSGGFPSRSASPANTW